MSDSHRLRRKLFKVTERTLQRTVMGLHALHSGVWLGMLDRTDLNALALARYASLSQYSNRDYNLTGLFDWEKRVIEEHFPSSGELLIGACGGGREVVALLQSGYAVTAFDCVPELTSTARELVSSPNRQVAIVDAPPDVCPRFGRTFDAAIAGWGGYMHIRGSARRIAFLRDMHAQLRGGAPVLVSFFPRLSPAVHALAYRVGRLIAALRFSNEAIERGDMLTNGSFHHYFTREEVERELAAAGFAMKEYRETPYGHAVGVREG